MGLGLADKQIKGSVLLSALSTIFPTTTTSYPVIAPFLRTPGCADKAVVLGREVVVNPLGLRIGVGRDHPQAKPGTAGAQEHGAAAQHNQLRPDGPRRGDDWRRPIAP